MTDGGFDLSGFSMLDLFRMEVETQAGILNENLLALEIQPESSKELEALMRASHSIKGAARIVQLEAAVKIAHTMEDCFVAAQGGKIALGADQIDVLFQGVDLLEQIGQLEEANLENWLTEKAGEIDTRTNAIAKILTPESAPPSLKSPQTLEEKTPQVSADLQDREAVSDAEVERNQEFLAQTQEEEEREIISETEKGKDRDEVISETKESRNTNLSELSILELFDLEVQTQAPLFQDNLETLQTNPQSQEILEILGSASHSLYAAAQIAKLAPATKITECMEACFLAAKEGKVTFSPQQVETLTQGISFLSRLAQVEKKNLESWLTKQQGEIDALISAIASIRKRRKSDHQKPPTQKAPPTSPPNLAATPSHKDRVVRVSADNLNRLMGLAGESLVEANWLQPFADSLLTLKKRQSELSKLLEKLQETLPHDLSQESEESLKAARAKEQDCREILSDRLNQLELFARRTTNLSDRLYREVISSHMRPFSDGIQGFPRMVRDLARKLNKQVKLEIIGKSTPVDRDILTKLEAPLTHILRNSIDHGIESPETRLAVGKPPEGLIRLEAHHRSGMLSINISDDGKGIDLDQLRQKIIKKKLVTPEMAAQLSEGELMEFLFLPGFSTAKEVTEISGRGVGLDIAKSMAHEVGGTLRATSRPGKGLSFHFQLPLTLSVIRTLLVEISGEAYAFPLTRIEQIVMLNREDISVAENRQYFTLNDQHIGLVAASQILELPETSSPSQALAVVVISDSSHSFGLVVDKFIGEKDLVVRPLDPRLGKVQDLSAAAILGDGSPVLIVDVSDLARSIDNLLNHRQLQQIHSEEEGIETKKLKRILVVDDSITVREMERKLLQNRGYDVDVAVDGMEGWNAIRTNRYDLTISDIDMPRMNGIELVSNIKRHPTLKSIPVIIVSYKDREEDRLQGLEAGADYYLTKSSFHDDRLVDAVVDLIGHP